MLFRSDDSSVHILSHTVHYGTGVFEGVRAYETEKGAAIFRLEDHTKRLFEAAKKINIEIPYSQDELNKVQKDIFIKNDLSEGYLRPIVFMGSESQFILDVQFCYQQSIFRIVRILYNFGTSSIRNIDYLNKLFRKLIDFIYLNYCRASSIFGAVQCGVRFVRFFNFRKSLLP